MSAQPNDDQDYIDHLKQRKADKVKIDEIFVGDKTDDKLKQVKSPSDKPRRPVCGYNIFFHLQRERLQKQGIRDVIQLSSATHAHTWTTEEISLAALALQDRPKRRHVKNPGGSIAFKDLVKYVAEQWKLVNPEVRQLFERQAAFSTGTYQTKLKEWKESNQCNPNDPEGAKNDSRQQMNSPQGQQKESKQTSKQHQPKSRKQKRQQGQGHDFTEHQENEPQHPPRDNAIGNSFGTEDKKPTGQRKWYQGQDPENLLDLVVATGKDDHNPTRLDLPLDDKAKKRKQNYTRNEPHDWLIPYSRSTSIRSDIERYFQPKDVSKPNDDHMESWTNTSNKVLKINTKIAPQPFRDEFQEHLPISHATRNPFDTNDIVSDMLLQNKPQSFSDEALFTINQAFHEHSVRNDLLSNAFDENNHSASQITTLLAVPDHPYTLPSRTTQHDSNISTSQRPYNDILMRQPQGLQPTSYNNFTDIHHSALFSFKQQHRQQAQQNENRYGNMKRRVNFEEIWDPDTVFPFLDTRPKLDAQWSDSQLDEMVEQASGIREVASLDQSNRINMFPCNQNIGNMRRLEIQEMGREALLSASHDIGMNLHRHGYDFIPGNKFDNLGNLLFPGEESNLSTWRTVNLQEHPMKQNQAELHRLIHVEQNMDSYLMNDTAKQSNSGISFDTIINTQTHNIDNHHTIYGTTRVLPALMNFHQEQQQQLQQMHQEEPTVMSHQSLSSMWLHELDRSEQP